MCRFLKVCLVVAGLVLPLTSHAYGYSGEVYTVCKLDPKGDNYLALRKCPSGECAEVRRLPPGQFVWTEEPFTENGWRAVIVMNGINDEYPVDRPRGYVFDKYICYVDMRD